MGLKSLSHSKWYICFRKGLLKIDPKGSLSENYSPQRLREHRENLIFVRRETTTNKKQSVTRSLLILLAAGMSCL